MPVGYSFMRWVAPSLVASAATTKPSRARALPTVKEARARLAKRRHGITNWITPESQARLREMRMPEFDGVSVPHGERSVGK